MKKPAFYIPQALELIQQENSGFFNKDQKIKKEYNGYIASFGASLLQSGALPAVALFSAQKDNVQSKSPLLKALRALLKLSETGTNSWTNKNKLLDYVIERQKSDPDGLHASLVSATIALKVAMRTFAQEKEEDGKK